MSLFAPLSDSFERTTLFVLRLPASPLCLLIRFHCAVHVLFLTEEAHWNYVFLLQMKIKEKKKAYQDLKKPLFCLFDWSFCLLFFF